MKRSFLILLCYFIAITVFGQNEGKQREGTVSYVTSRNVYVKFSSTEGIKEGDTLYVSSGAGLVAGLKVTGLSSMSCVCEPIGEFKGSQGLKVYFHEKLRFEKQETPDQAVVPLPDNIVSQTQKADSAAKPDAAIQRKQNIRGRVSVASYSYLSNTPSDQLHRMRYTFSLNAKNINDSRVSAESYITFSHKSDRWSEIKDNVFNGLKIYNLAVSYDATDRLKLTAGRKINPRLSNMGAVDGLQAEYMAKTITVGALVGSRPHTTDYSVNTSLFQYGLFISHDKAVKDGTIQTTFAFVDQRNTGFVDRRFTYVQHSNSMVKNLYLFGSAEFDLYRIENEVSKNSPKLSNLYFSARYRILKNLSASLSYSARTNIIYYETYKSFLERLLENEMQQGYGAQLSYRPLKHLAIGANAGYRKRKDDPNASKNAYIYASYNKLPFFSSVTLSGTYLETSYLTGKVYSASFNKDIFKSKVNATLTYRYQDYLFSHSETSLLQHTGELSLNWNIIKKLALSVNYEGTFEEVYTYNRIYLQLSKRF